MHDNPLKVLWVEYLILRLYIIMQEFSLQCIVTNCTVFTTAPLVVWIHVCTRIMLWFVKIILLYLTSPTSGDSCCCTVPVLTCIYWTLLKCINPYVMCNSLKLQFWKTRIGLLMLNSTKLRMIQGKSRKVKVTIVHSCNSLSWYQQSTFCLLVNNETLTHRWKSTSGTGYTDGTRYRIGSL